MRFLRPFLKIILLIGITTWLTAGFGSGGSSTGVTDPVPSFNQARGYIKCPERRE